MTENMIVHGLKQKWKLDLRQSMPSSVILDLVYASHTESISERLLLTSTNSVVFHQILLKLFLLLFK